MGELGNQILEYLSLLALWKIFYLRFRYHKFVAVIETSMKETLEEVFQNINIPSLPSTKNFNWTTVSVPETKNFKFPNISKGKKYGIVLDDYSARYEDVICNNLLFTRYIPKIRLDLKNDVKRYLQHLSFKYNIDVDFVKFVGIHYRGSDYVDYMSTVYGEEYIKPYIPDYRYYVSAMDVVNELFPSVVFVMITSDEEWLGKNLAPILANGIVEVNPFKERGLDFSLLAHCHANIISYGKFAVAAALYSNKPTILHHMDVYTNHFGPSIAKGIKNFMGMWCTGNASVVDFDCIKNAFFPD